MGLPSGGGLVQMCLGRIRSSIICFKNIPDGLNDFKGVAESSIADARLRG